MIEVVQLRTCVSFFQCRETEQTTLFERCFFIVLLIEIEIEIDIEIEVDSLATLL